MCIRVPRLGMQCKVVTAKSNSTESGCVPNYPLISNYLCLRYFTPPIRRMSTLQCEIRSLRGDEFKKTAEITGDRTSHLSSLSANLTQMQSEVNSFLTQLVEKEKAEKKSSTPKGESSAAATSGDEGVYIHFPMLQLSSANAFSTFMYRYGGRRW